MAVSKSDKRTELFESAAIPKAVASLCVPTIISSLVMVLYNLADTYFVGMLNDPVQNAAVTLAGPVLLAFNAVNNLFGVGSSSMMSRALGRKDYDTVHRSSAFGFYCALVCGVFFSLLCTAGKAPLLVLLGADEVTLQATSEYMRWTVTWGAVPAILNVVLAYMVRSEGAAFHASAGTMSGCLLNIVLDPIFILPQGLGLGAAGAGLATFISNCVACTYFFILIYKKRNSTCVCLRPSQFCLKGAIVLGVCGVGIPASIQNLLNVTGMTILNNFTSVFGADAVAAMGITQKIYMVPMYVCMGVSQGIMPLVSYNYASGNQKRMKSAIVFAGEISIGFITAAAVFFLPRRRGGGAVLYGQSADYQLRNPVFAGILSRIAVSVYGFSCSRCFPGTRFWEKRAYFCHHEKNCVRDTSAVSAKLSVSAVRACLCAVCGGVCACDCGGGGAFADFSQAWQETGVR